MIYVVDPAVLCLGLLPTGWQFPVGGMLIGHVIRASPAVQNGLSGETLLLSLLLCLLLCLLLLLGDDRCTPVPAAAPLLRLIAIATVVGRRLLAGRRKARDQTGRDLAQRGRTAVGSTVMDR